MGAVAYLQSNSAKPTLSEGTIKRAQERLNEPFTNTGGENPYSIHQELQQTTNDLVGIIRTKKELEESLEKLAKFRERIKNVSVSGGREFNPGFHLALDLENMLLVSECMARSALIREESRGGHTREDFPKMDSKWRQVNNVSSVDGNSVKCVQERAKMLPDELAGLFEKSELAKYFTEDELAGVKGGSN
ncbi:unannotated protein [freshwater metagenome]|uniref:Unannotated protein n=1 Tax=freshwater metagenome TaxID=449393 RepID=A0A6J6CG30_9ZZZZ